MYRRGCLYGCTVFMQPVLGPSPKCSYMLNRSSCESVFRMWRQLPRGFDLPFVTHFGYHKPKDSSSTSISPFCALLPCRNISQRSVCVLFFPATPLPRAPATSSEVMIFNSIRAFNVRNISNHRNKPHAASLSYH